MFVKKMFIIFTIIVPSLNAQNADYFPLQIGNKWVYNWQGVEGYISREIIDTLTINDNLYYSLLEEQDSSFWGKDTLFYFYRKDSLNRVWFAHPNTFNENLTTIQFNRSPGLIECTYDSINNLTNVTILKDTNYTVITPAGTFYNCYYFYSLLVEIHTDFVDIYAPNVGLVRVKSEGEGWILKGALVNGVLFGDTTKTIIDKVNHVLVPEDFELYQNYPNPFNQSTVISYQFNNPTAANVELIIYDIIGKEVITLVDEKQNAGRHFLNWDGKNKFGQYVSSGLYVYQIRIEGFSTSRKLLITK